MSRPQPTCQAIRVAIALLGLIVLPAVGQTSEVRYRCADGTTVVARFEPGQVDLKMRSGVVNLPQAGSADGGRYMAGEIIFWIKGRGAALTRGAVQTHCSVLP